MRALPVGLLTIGVLAGCLPGETRLDEHVFHDEPGLRLKLVRYYEQLPFHYDGEVYAVMCQSAATRDFPAHETQDAGWRKIANGGAIGTNSAEAALTEIEGRYRILPGPTLVWLGTVLRVSFDGCGRMAMWDPTSLPADRIDPAPKPDFCAPRGGGDCRYMDFDGDRAPVYQDLTVDAERRWIGFRVSSTAFRPTAELAVTSGDGGLSWQVDP